MQQIEQNLEENRGSIGKNPKILNMEDIHIRFDDRSLFEVVRHFMNALNDMVPFDGRNTYISLQKLLEDHHRNWKELAEVPKRPKNILPDNILPGEFGQFGLLAVLEATMLLVPGTIYDTSTWQPTLRRWGKYFPELEVAWSAVQGTAQSKEQKVAQSAVPETARSEVQETA
ncbi:d60c5de8-d28e-4a8e-aa60-ffd025e63287 [Sclerotinia trifoliorum]|uniref:D60c5de8-d28e-4a8e-aa60-ffd025e63287 n=1 Tax=Sclerotinia trifoliorum TaxID=28548 RepID=A0A8H2VQD9_9HELO|nr:d60c5de8-d28e-4a8e-aa60-ffd025e63287 [Sclerotinia trifoliorum]